MNPKLPKNFEIGAKVTWRSTNRSSWIDLLEKKFGSGPFEVVHAEMGLYENPKVMLGNRQTDKPLFILGGDDLFNKSWLEEWKE